MMLIILPTTENNSVSNYTKCVFDWLFSDPLVIENFFQVFDKNSQNDREGVRLAKNNARYGLCRVNYPYLDSLFDQIYNYLHICCSIKG